MYLFFLASALALLGCVFFRKRIVDLFTVFVVALNVYYMPLYFGMVRNSVSRTYEPPHDGVYTVFFLVNLVSLVSVILFDGLVRNNEYKPIKDLGGASNVFIKSFLLALMLMGLVVFDFSYINLGSKLEIMSALGVRYTVFMALVLLIAVYSVVYGDKLFSLIGGGMLLSTFIIGSRSTIVLFGLIFVVNYFTAGQRKIRTLNLVNMVVISIAIMVIASSKYLYEAMILHGIADGFRVYASSFSFDTVLGGMEGQSTQYILSRVIETDFGVPALHIPQGFLRLLPMPADIYGFNVTDFNDLFQPALFPSITYGLAYNPWAEAYSWGGYVGVGVMAIFYLMLIYALNWHIFFNNKKIIRVLCIVVGVYFAFWIHRNSLGSIFSYVRNIIYPFLGAWVFASVISLLLSRRAIDNSQGQSGNMER